MSYTRQYATWFDFPTLTTPVTAAVMNGIEAGINGLSVGSTLFDKITMTSGTTSANGIIFGGVGGDTVLYRSAASDLRTDGRLLAGTNIAAVIAGAQQTVIGNVGTGSTSGILFGLAGDTNLYRVGATRLKTDSTFVVGSTGVLELTESGNPGNGAADTGRLFLQDNGAGKTQLMVVFATGAAIQLAIQA